MEITPAGSNASQQWVKGERGIVINGSSKISFSQVMKNSLQAGEPDKAQLEKLKKACQDFESFFLYYMLNQMQSTLPKDGIIEESRPMEFYRDMFNEAVADKMARTKGAGLASMLYENLKKTLSVSAKSTE